jgi:hypothetical protein
MLQPGSVVSGKIGASAVGSYELQDDIGIGSASANGYLRTYGNGSTASLLGMNTNNDGMCKIFTSAGGWVVASLNTYSDHSGGVTAHRGVDGVMTAWLNGSTGGVYGSTFNLTTPDPFEPGRSMQYSALGGAEVAVYLRGRARVTGGRGHVSFPDYFSGMTVASSVTVTLTPRSLDSKGLAVTNSDNLGMDVGELAGGTGSYEFDYVVYGVRKGFEDFQVYVKNPDLQSTSGGLSPGR